EGVGEGITGQRVVVPERRVVGGLELLRDRADLGRLRPRAVGRQTGKALGVEVRDLARHLVHERAVDRGVRGDRRLDARVADRADQLRAERLPGPVEDRVTALDRAAEAGDLRAEVEVRSAEEAVLAADLAAEREPAGLEV